MASGDGMKSTFAGAGGLYGEAQLHRLPVLGFAVLSPTYRLSPTCRQRRTITRKTEDKDA